MLNLCENPERVDRTDQPENVPCDKSLATLDQLLCDHKQLRTLISEHKLLKEAIENSPLPYSVYDDSCRLIAWNPAYERLHPETFQALKAEGEKTHLTYQDVIRPQLEAAELPNDTTIDAEIERRTCIHQSADGSASERMYPSVGWLRAIKYPVNGGVAGLGINITELKDREQQLNETKARSSQLLSDFRILIDTMKMGVVLVNEKLECEIINRAFFDIWNLAPATIPEGSHFRALMDVNRANGIYDVSDDEWEDYIHSRCQEIIAGDIEPREFERNDGKTLIYTITALSGGKCLISYFDVSEQKQRERELEEARSQAEAAETAKAAFLANMSHEIRTPMNGVLGMAELLANTELNSKQKTFADIIHKSGNALLTIINDILDFSKVDAGQMTLVPEGFKLGEAVEDVATLMASRASEKDLELIVRVQPDLPSGFIGDVGRLRQIVTNLTGNAVKFTEKGHVLLDVTGEVNSRDDEDVASLKFTISDTGCGIPEDKLDHVFQQFSQVDETTTRRHEGTGLGLAISTGLVDLMDGEIGVESTYGEGSTFWFRIDLPVDTTIKSKCTRNLEFAENAQVLVIDDNTVNRAILLEQLSSWRMQGAAVASGKEGLETLNAAVKHNLDIDAIILDFQMPEMNGAEVAKILRDDPKLNHIPVVLLTSMDLGKDESSLEELQVHAHLMKPARSSLLLETLLEAIATGRENRQ